MKVLFRLYLLCIVVFAALTCGWAGGATSYLLPSQRFQSWTALANTCTDTLLHQEWKTAITGIAKEASGYTLIAYQAEKTDAPATAARRAAALMLKARFQDYIAKGYTVTTVPWDVMGQRGMQFSVFGTAYTASSPRANHAEIYTLAFTRESWVVWLEVRESGTGTDQKMADDAVRKGGAKALATDLAALMPALWPQQPATAPEPEPITVTPGPLAPPPGQEGVIIAVPVEPTTPTTDPAQPPTNPIMPVTPPAIPVTPVEHDPKRWYAPDGHLSLLLPPGWKITGTMPSVITGMQEGEIRLYAAETYTGDTARDAALRDFIETQRAVSSGKLTSEAINVGGAPGVCVRYVNYLHRTTLVWYFGAGGLLWRLEVELPGDAAPVPLGMQVLTYSMRVE